MSHDATEIASTQRRERDRALVGGIAWAAAARTVSQLATWAVSLLVARLLSPADYGVVSAATAYLGFIALVTEFGLATAIVSQRDLSDDAIAQLGGLSLSLGLVAWLVTVIAAPWVAATLGVEELRRVLPVLGFSTALSSLNSLPFALLQKQLRFRTQSNIEVTKAVVASSALLVLALSGAGYWALVLNEVCAVLVVTAVLYVTLRYRVAVPRWHDIKSSLHMSGQVLSARAAWYAYSNADIAIVSRRAGKLALGSYSMAWNLTTLPSQKIASMIMGVTTGVFASVQKDIAEIQRYFLRIAEALALVLFPATIGMALVAPEMVGVVLGPKWADAVPIIQSLALATTIRTLGPICSQVLLARLKAAVEMRYTILSAIVLPVGFWIGSRYGAIGVARSWSIMSPPLVAFQLWLTCKEIELPVKRLLGTLAGPVAAVVVMALGVSAVRAVASPVITDRKLLLALLIATGGAAYAGTVFLTMRTRVIALITMVRARKR